MTHPTAALTARLRGRIGRLFSPTQAAGLIRPPLLGITLGGLAAGITFLASRSTPLAALAFVVTWILSAALIVRGFRFSIIETVDETQRIQEKLRLGLLAWAVAGVYVFLGEILILVAASLPGEIAVPIVEVTVLAGTVAYLALFARYTAAAFTSDVDRLVNETRASASVLGASFVSSTEGLGDAYASNTDGLLKKLDEQGGKQAEVLVSMANALNEMASLSKIHGQVMEDTRKLGEEALRIQREAVETGRRLEKERTDAQERAEGEARRRMMPKLGLRVRVSSVGAFSHHIFVDVLNTGMSGQALEVSLSVNGGAASRKSGATLSTQEQKAFDFGDVSNFPSHATLAVVSRIADAAGRPYQFKSDFPYSRTTGFFGQTKSTSVEPTGFLWPDSRQLD